MSCSQLHSLHLFHVGLRTNIIMSRGSLRYWGASGQEQGEGLNIKGSVWLIDRLSAFQGSYSDVIVGNMNKQIIVPCGGGG